MAKSSPGGRYTPKKSTDPKEAADEPGLPRHAGPPASDAGVTVSQPAYRNTGRYTPPIPRDVRESPPWVAYVMFTLLILGVLTIVCNYLNLLPGDASNWYLLLGLGFITGGFVTATHLH